VWHFILGYFLLATILSFWCLGCCVSNRSCPGFLCLNNLRFTFADRFPQLFKCFDRCCAAACRACGRCCNCGGCCDGGGCRKAKRPVTPTAVDASAAAEVVGAVELMPVGGAELVLGAADCKWGEKGGAGVGVVLGAADGGGVVSAQPGAAAAAAAAAAPLPPPGQFCVQCPADGVPGTILQVRAPDGQAVPVAVPDGVAAGDFFTVPLPPAPAEDGAGAEPESKKALAKHDAVSKYAGQLQLMLWKVTEGNAKERKGNKAHGVARRRPPASSHHKPSESRAPTRGLCEAAVSKRRMPLDVVKQLVLPLVRETLATPRAAAIGRAAVTQLSDPLRRALRAIIPIAHPRAHNALLPPARPRHDLRSCCS
jgi:hypothetical protein